jgi:hypothetical protein
MMAAEQRRSSRVKVYFRLLTLGIALLVVLLVFWNRTPSHQEPPHDTARIARPQPEAPPTTTATLPEAYALSEGLEVESAGDPNPAAETSSFLRAIVKDAYDGSVVPGLMLHYSTPTESGSVTSDSEGVVEIRRAESLRVSSGDPSFRVMNFEALASGARGHKDLWVYRYFRIHGRVELENPERARESGPTVSARPVAGDRKPTADADAGTSAWVDALFRRNRLPWKASTTGGVYELEVPILRAMTVAASAPGHVPEVRDLGDVEAGADVELNFELKAATSLRATVTDENGRPLKGASVQFKYIVSVPTAEANIEEYRLVKRVSHVGFSAGSSDQTGLTTVAYTASRITDEEGGASLFQVSQPSSGGKFFLMVNEMGYEPFLADVDGVHIEQAIVLRKIRPAREFYRLRSDGKWVGAGVKLQLFVWGDGRNLSLKYPLLADDQGRFRGTLVAPGLEYYGFLDDPDGVGRISGKLRFGSDEEVDISHWD